MESPETTPVEPAVLPNTGTPIRAEAFRFVHFTQPKPVDITPGKDVGFIHHPKVLIGESVLSDKTYAPFKSVSEISTTFRELYGLSIKLKSSNWTEEDIPTLVKEASPLSDVDRERLWSGIIQHAQKPSVSSRTKDTILHLLQADHFLVWHGKSITGKYSELIDLKVAASASVIIPNEALPQRPKGKPVTKRLDGKSRNIISRKLLFDAHKHRRDVLNKAIAELRPAEEIYQKIVRGMYEVEREKHEEILTEFNSQFISLRAELTRIYEQIYKYEQELNAIKIVHDESVNTGISQEEIEASKKKIEELESQLNLVKLERDELKKQEREGMLKAPTLSFIAPPFIGSATFLRNLSDFNKYLVEEIAFHLSDRNEDVMAKIGVGEVRQYLETKLIEESSKMLANVPQSPKRMLYMGSIIEEQTKPQDNCFSFVSLSSLAKPEEKAFYLTQYSSSSDAQVEDLSFGIGNVGENSHSFSDHLDPISQEKGFVTYEFAAEGAKIDESKLVNITAEFLTKDGRKGEFKTETSLKSSKAKVYPQPCLDGEPGYLITSMNGVKKLGVAEFKVVEQELCCYVEGEVSHIENIMAREYKEKSTRSLNRTEITTETTKEREQENLKDTTSTERNEMQSEVSQVLQEDQSNTFGASASVYGSFGDWGGFNAGANYSTTNSSSANNSFNEAENYAKEVTERAMKRIVEKVSSKRVSRIMREYEENNRHGFDNRKGDKHVTGVYRWVDKIYKNELFNYGKRLVYQFMIPEPSRNLKHLLVEKVSNNNVDLSPFLPEAPLNLEESTIFSPSDINKGNYAELAAKYGVELEAPLDEFIWLSKNMAEHFGHSDVDNQRHNAFSYELEIPEGFQADIGHWKFTSYTVNTDGHQQALGYIGNNSFKYDFELPTEGNTWGANLTSSHPWLPGENYIPIWEKPEKVLSISLRTVRMGSFALSLLVKVVRKNESYERWQSEAYQILQRGYNERLLEYNEVMKEYLLTNGTPSNTENDKKVEKSLMLARGTEKRELKRLAIDMITRQLAQYTNVPGMGQNFYTGDDSSVQHVLQLSNTMDNYAEHARFIEEAFDWEIMAYDLLPYYWAATNEWGSLLKTNLPADPIFQAFLQAGIARMSVPVRGGYEKQVMYYLDTGDIMESDAPVLDDPDGIYSAVVKGLVIETNRDGTRKVEATWHNRTPTQLTIIQDYANPLDRNGLPCGCPKEANSLSPLGGVPKGELPNGLGRADIDDTDSTEE